MSEQGAVVVDGVAELAAARAEIQTLKARLSGVSVADQMICQAEIEAANSQAELASADAVRKEAKKRFEAAIEHLRSLVRDRASGQMALPFDAPADVVTDRIVPASQAAADGPPVAVEDVATADDMGPDDEAATGTPDEIPAGTRKIDARLGSISVPGEADEMVSVAPGVVSLLACEDLHTVKDVWPLLRDGKLKIKGLGPAKMKSLTEIVTAWLGDDATAAVDDGPRERGEATHQYCEECREWLGLDVGLCGTCAGSELHTVGFYGDQSVDADGDIVAGCETLAFAADVVPASSVLVVEKPDGWRSGWMVEDDGGDEVGAYPSILKPGHETRPKAIAAAVAEMRKYIDASGMAESLEAWDRAAIERCGAGAVPKTVLPF